MDINKKEIFNLYNNKICSECNKLAFTPNKYNFEKNNYNNLTDIEKNIIGDWDKRWRYHNFVFSMYERFCPDCNNFNRFSIGGLFCDVDYIFTKDNFKVVFKQDRMSLGNVNDIFNMEDLNLIRKKLKNLEEIYKKKEYNMFEIFSINFFYIQQDDILLYRKENGRIVLYRVFNFLMCYRFCELDNDFKIIEESIYDKFINPDYLA